MYVIGVDPGPIPGVVGLVVRDSRIEFVDVVQCTAPAIERVLTGLSGERVAMAVERFVVGQRASRSRTPEGGAAARGVTAQVEVWAGRRGFSVYLRSAAEVKPWATDDRLAAAGLLELTKGMRHARDAARHALFCAVKDFGLPDPLSRKAGAR